jgi:hypothetical protein
MFRPQRKDLADYARCSKTEGTFPVMRQATKLIYLVLRVNITKKWEKPPITWKLTASQICDQIREKIFRSRRRLKTMKKWRVVSNDLNNPGGLFTTGPARADRLGGRSRRLQLTSFRTTLLIVRSNARNHDPHTKKLILPFRTLGSQIRLCPPIIDDSCSSSSLLEDDRTSQSLPLGPQMHSAQTFSSQQFSQRIVKFQHCFILHFDSAEACKQKLLAMRR